MRDTQNKELGHLSFTYAEWNAFIETTLSTATDNPLRDGIAILQVERGPLGRSFERAGGSSPSLLRTHRGTHILPANRPQHHRRWSARDQAAVEP